MPEVFNTQRKISLEISLLREFATNLSDCITEAESKNFAVAFISDRRMKELNQFFRGKHSTTDVLSFRHEPDEFVRSASFSVSSASDEEQAEACTLNEDFLGDIVISAEQAERQAAENGLTLEAEIKQLILHGVLHLCGYDHETDTGEMNSRELKLREELGI